MTSRTTAPIQDRTSRLLGLLLRQKSLAEQLVALAPRQEQAVRDENAEALLALLSTRQEFIDRIMAAQREISPLLSRDEDPTEFDRISTDERVRAQDLIEDIEKGLAAVMKADDEAREAIRAIQDRAREEIRTFGRTQQARRAYGPQDRASAGAVAPRFSDRKG